MRKAYGPTDISFNYPNEAFKADIDKGIKFVVELVFAGECYYPEFDLAHISENKCSLKAFYDKADCMSIQRNGTYLLQILT
jgi:hypothetical protein